MDSLVRCLICRSQTEEGFVVDRGHGSSRLQQEWWAGAPERSFWTGLKKPDEVLRVRAMRCVKCGFLMEFAASVADQ